MCDWPALTFFSALQCTALTDRVKNMNWWKPAYSCFLALTEDLKVGFLQIFFLTGFFGKVIMKK